MPVAPRSSGDEKAGLMIVTRPGHDTAKLRKVCEKRLTSKLSNGLAAGMGVFR
ncbi:MAG: hypothetical protein K0U93_09175 [Gammaproteobacteria bacterium]|nr:hypothetical protein [Gammaproteobacteria bacterium]